MKGSKTVFLSTILLYTGGCLHLHAAYVVGGPGSNPLPCLPATAPSVPNAQGWIGGDGGASVPMPDGSAIWLFGDSFIGHTSAVSRDHAYFLHNSIGISSCNGNTWGGIDHYWVRDDSTYVEFFPSSGPVYYWPGDGFYYGNRLYVLLNKIESAPDQALGFRSLGASLATVSTMDPTWTAPNDWTTTITEINSSTMAIPSSTAVVDGDYVYVYGFLTGGSYTLAPMFVVRAPLVDLPSFASNMEYLSQDGSWRSGLAEDDLQIVMDRGAPQMTIRYHAAQNEWIAVYIPADLATPQIVMRTAPTPLGPWSDPQVIYEIPEMTPGSPVYDPTAFCYSAVEHTEWMTSNSMVVTYSCNSSTDLFDNMEIYRPVSVEIPLQ